jgi:hypothetical protein
MITEKPVVIVDPHARRMGEIFSPDDLARLHDLVRVLWGRDEAMPEEEVRSARPRSLSLFCDM